MKLFAAFLAFSIMTVAVLGTTSACTLERNKSDNIGVEDKVTSDPNDAVTATPTDSADDGNFAFDLTEEVKSKPDHQLAFLSNENAAVIFGGENSPYIIEGSFENSYIDSLWSPMTSLTFHLTEAVEHIAYSIDKTAVAFIMRDTANAARTLMYFDGTDMFEVSRIAGSFCFSSDGSVLAYINDSCLYVYDCVTGESRLITENASSYFALSPTGKSISYCVWNGDNFVCYYLQIGSNPVLIGSSCYPVALSDDCSVVYFYDVSNEQTEFCVLHSGTRQILIQSAILNNSENIYITDLIFNKDCTQVVFLSGSTYYFSTNGGKPVEATGGMVVDNNSKYYVNDSFVRAIYVDAQSVFPFFVDAKNLCNLLFCQGTSLTYFDENFAVHSFPISEYSYGFLSEGGDALMFYTYNYDEYPNKFTYTYVSDYLDPACSMMVLEEKYIRSAVLTSNDTIYYCNDIGLMYVIRGTDSPVKLDKNVSELYTMDVGDKTYVYYLKQNIDTYTYTLYCMEDAPDSEIIMIDQEVWNIDICDAGLIYYKNRIDGAPDYKQDDIYFAADGIHGEYVCTLFSYM